MKNISVGIWLLWIYMTVMYFFSFVNPSPPPKKSCKCRNKFQKDCLALSYISASQRQFSSLSNFFYLRYWKAFLMEHSYYVTVHSTTTCSRWVFVGTPEHIMQGLNNGSTNIASTNQVTTLSAQQVFATCYSITPVQSNACITNLFCWNRYTEPIQCPCRISVVQQSVVRQLFKESTTFLYRIL